MGIEKGKGKGKGKGRGGKKEGTWSLGTFFSGGGLGRADLLLVITRDSYIISSSSFSGGGGKGGEGNGCIP